MNQVERQEFRDYVVASSPSLLRVAYLMTGNSADAEDLLQTALAKTYLAWPRIRDHASVDAYVRRVMLNTRTSGWRRARHLRTVPLDSRPEHPVTRDPIDDIDLHESLWSAMSTLSRRQRAAVVLRYYEDLSEPETAAVLGVSVGTVKSTVSRALRKLRDEAGLHDDDRAALPDDLTTELRGATP